MIRLCVFDFDSTLMDGETIDILAEAYGVGNEVEDITRRAMGGSKNDFFEDLVERVSLLKGMSYARVLELCESLPLMKGGSELVEFLRTRGVLTVVFSGGFHEGVNPAMRKLGFDAAFANRLHQKDGKLTGLVGGEMMFLNSKGLMLKKLKKILKLKDEEVMCIGDGANDVAMFEESGLKIAFCAKEILRSKADFCVDSKDLREVIKLLK